MDWIIRLGLITIEIILILKGIYTNDKNKENLDNAADITTLSDSPVGCLGDIITFGLGGFLRSIPVWFVNRYGFC